MRPDSPPPRGDSMAAPARRPRAPLSGDLAIAARAERDGEPRRREARSVMRVGRGPSTRSRRSGSGTFSAAAPVHRWGGGARFGGEA